MTYAKSIIGNTKSIIVVESFASVIMERIQIKKP